MSSDLFGHSSDSLATRLSRLEEQLSDIRLSQIEEELIGEVNRNNQRLDLIIESVRKLMKVEPLRKKQMNSTPDKLQPRRLKDRVDKVIQEGQASKYIK